MRLIELRLKNLNSLKGEWHIDFTDPAFICEGIFAITGQTGAGKTTILDAICLALYSQTPRLGDITATSNEMMTQGTGECSAEVVIEIGGKHYRCFWYQHRAHKKAKGKLASIVHEISEVKTGDILEDAKSKTALFIKDLIGMDFSQFTRSIMLAQGGFAAFLKSETWERAAILEKITGTAIYAQISKNVFEKKRDKEHELAKLQAGVDSVPLLSAEEEKQLAAELAHLNQQHHTQRQTVKTLNEQLQWLDNVQELQHNLSIYQADFSAAQQAQQLFAPKAQRLDIANKALELDGQYLELSYSRDIVKRLHDEQQALLSKIPAQQEALEQASMTLKIANAIEKQAADSLQATLPIIKKTRELDADIKQQSQSLEDACQRKNVWVSSNDKLRQAIKSHEKNEQDIKDQLTNIQRYFSDYQELSDLDTDMATFDNNCSRLKALLQSNVRLNADKRAHHNQHRQLQADFNQLNVQQNLDKSRVQQQREVLTSLQQQQSALIQDQPIANIRAEQEQIDQISTQIEQVSFNLRQLSQLASQIQTINISMPTLSQELMTLDHLMASHQLDVRNNKLKKQDKQKHLDLLQKVAKLEDYIRELKDGAPCPLCGAHEHPYGNNHPLLDRNADNKNQPSQTQQTQQQITELETLIENLEQNLSKYSINHATKKAAVKNQQQQLALLQQQSKALSADIRAYLSSLFDVNKAYSKSIIVIINPLIEMDNDIDAIVNNVDGYVSLLEGIKQQFIEKKQSLKTISGKYDDLTDSISTLNVAVERNETQQQSLIRDISNLTTELKLSSQKTAGITDKITANFSELTPIIFAVSSLVHKYPADKYKNHLPIVSTATDIQNALKQLDNSINQQTILASVDYDGHIDRLRQQRSTLSQLKQNFNEQKNNQQQLSNTLSSTCAQIAAKQAQLTDDETALNTLQQLIADKTDIIDKLKENRKQTFADKNPDYEDAHLRCAIDEAKSKQVNAQRQEYNIQQALEQLKLREQQLETELKSASITLDTQQTHFTDLLVKSQFVDEDAFINARLPKEERGALQMRKLAFDHSLQQARLHLKTTEQALAQKLATPMTAENRERLAEQQLEIQTDIDTLNQQIGAFNQKLKDNDNQKGQQSAQLEAINAQKQALQVWQQLYELIGSADGKKYRNFAQGLTFQVMINHANVQLKKMSDRYLLAPDTNNPLELNVIDNYQGGDIRSTKNLSGGEGFIISLALALGLSQMASQNTRVDSLFLDEGFGTLDEESLDIALDTLTNLQQEGKIIGIISHVQALKARIFTQIHVKKLSGGFSEITGQGCYKIAG